jgi:hypothetical protein
MRRIFLLVCVSLLSLTVANAQAPGDAYIHADTNLSFPTQIGAYRRVAVTKYPDPRLGVSIRYDGWGRGDIFVYDMGFTQITTGIDSPEFKRAFAESEAHIAKMSTSPPFKDGGRFLESQPVVESDGRVAKLRVVMYTSTLLGRDGSERKVSTWLLMTAYKNKLLKLLFTHQGIEPEKSQEELKALIGGFLQANDRETEHFFVKKSVP